MSQVDILKVLAAEPDKIFISYEIHARINKGKRRASHINLTSIQTCLRKLRDSKLVIFKEEVSKKSGQKRFLYKTKNI